MRSKVPTSHILPLAVLALCAWLSACSGADSGATEQGSTPTANNNQGGGPGQNNPSGGGGSANNEGGASNNGSGAPGNNGSATGDEEACVSNAQFFLREVWTPIIRDSCFNCHNPLGAASASEMVFEPEGQPGFIERNLEVFANVAAYERGGTSVMLLKPTMQVDHGGGRRIEPDSPEYQALEAMLARLQNPAPECPPDSGEDFFEGVVQHDPAQTFRKAAVVLGSRLPTWTEVEYLKQGGEQALEASLDRLMREKAFYERMEEVFNDLFLTEKYLGNTRALDLLDRTAFPGARWYDATGFDRSGLSPDFVRAGARHTNTAVAREPLKLVSYILQNNRPFGEIVSADYVVVNPFSAMALGVKGITWSDPLDPEEWRAGKIEGVPHAGVLSSPMIWNRFPTTQTNRNRHRARMVYRFFLATDVLKLGERPIDPTSVQHNPTMNDPQCAGCHSVVDPVAGALQAFDAKGSYQLPESWYTDMRQPGFGRDLMPPDERPRAHQWLGRRIANDERFDLSMVHLAFKALTGQDPLSLPSTGHDDADHARRLVAYERQQRDFERLAREFRANDHDMRALLKGIIKSPWFRAQNLTEAPGPERAESLRGLGTGRRLTPEMLSRKIQAVLGFPWRPRNNETDYLRRRDYYLVLYGGIDSDDVIERIAEPNGIMSAIQVRMANEMSCLAVPQDFAQPLANRRLFADVEPGFLPEDPNGFAIAQAQLAIRQNIQRLHRVILGEELAVDDPEIERTYQLFYDTWKEGYTLRLNDAIAWDLHWSCQARNDYWSGVSLGSERQVVRDMNYTIRAWMAVVSYLLMDHKFLYE